MEMSIKQKLVIAFLCGWLCDVLGHDLYGEKAYRFSHYCYIHEFGLTSLA